MNWFSVLNVRFPADFSVQRTMWGFWAFLTGRFHPRQGSGADQYWRQISSCQYCTEMQTWEVRHDAAPNWGLGFDATRFPIDSNVPERPWVVLQSPKALGPIYCVLTMDGDRWSPVFSKTIPTRGTPLSRPVAADEWEHQPALLAPTGNKLQFSGTISMRGDFLVFVHAQGVGPQVGLGCFKLEDAHPADQYPYATFAPTTADGMFTTKVFGSAANWASKSDDGSRRVAAAAIYPSTWEGPCVGYMSRSGEAGTKEHLDYPVYIASVDPEYRSMKGLLPEVSWALTSPDFGATTPRTGPVQATLAGNVWIPASSGLRL